MSRSSGLPAISVVVASHGRPLWLSRCLTALAQLDYPTFEIVVAADRAGLAAVSAHDAGAHCRTVAFDEPNLSGARNAGICEAAGTYVAFIDDDSVPEPLWLRRHAEALSATGAAASVGFVRGRNGISFQSRVASVDAEAETHTEPVTEADRAFLPRLAPGRALKMVGTNALVRREVLVALGGFDTSLRFFLEDSDLSLRLAAAGHQAAVAPRAEVHHAFAASARRTSLRRPKRLFDIGRSTAIFIRRHPGADPREILARVMLRERRRLIRHLVRGTCEPRDVRRLLDDLAAGWAEGMAAQLPAIRPLHPAPVGFSPFPQVASGHRVLTARLLRRRTRLAEARRLAAEGQRVSLFSFSLTPVRHHVRYLAPGVWVQTGGQFGRSDRTGPWFRWCRFARRAREECARVEKQRGIDKI